MSEIDVIRALAVCLGVIGLVLVALDRQNDRLRKENRSLRDKLDTKDADKEKENER